MATQFFFVEGDALWAHVINPTTKYNSKEPEYKITLELDNVGVDTHKRTGSQKKLVKGENGKMTVTYTRDPEKNSWNDEKLGPPKVFVEVDGRNEDFKELVGNGSRVIAKIAVYDTAKGKGTRLEAVKVLKHVPYTAQPKAPITTTDGGEVLPF